MKYFQSIITLLIIGMLVCCESSTDPLPEREEQIENPMFSTLIFPENNTECQEGVIINEFQSRVTFEWEVSEHTDSYEVHLKNLDDGSESIHESNINEVPIVLQRGKAYSWYVLSKADNSDQFAKSETWQFYNAGAGQVTHAPFPANLISPTNHQTVEITSGTITINWEASDVDNNIVAFEVFLDTSNPPAQLVGTTNTGQFNASVVSNTTYYWLVKTLDDTNNSSKSDVFSFMTQ